MQPFQARPRPQWTHPQLARSQPARRPVWIDPTLQSPAQQRPIIEAGGNRGALKVIDQNGPAVRPYRKAASPMSLLVDNESQDCQRGRTTRVMLTPALGASPAARRDQPCRPSQTMRSAVPPSPRLAASATLPGTPVRALPSTLLQSPAGRGREEGGPAPHERAAKRPCVSHAPAASPGRAALPCSPAPLRATPGLGERRMARPFSPARPVAPPNVPPTSALPPRFAACEESR